MLPLPATAALVEHLEHGMFYEIFSYDAIKFDRAAVLALCAADNYDCAFALGETEATLLRCIHSSLSLNASDWTSSLSGQYEAIREMTAASCGQKWEEEDVIAVYNFAKVIGKSHLDLFADTVSVHIAWDGIAVRPSDFHLMSRIDVHSPWLKIAMLATQYFAPIQKQLKGPFNKNYGSVFSKADFERIAKGSRLTLSKVETCLSYLVEVYMKTTELPPEKLAEEVPLAFVRTARAVLLTKDLVQNEVDLTKVEVKLREALGAGGLPPSFHTLVEDVKVDKKDQATSSIQPDTLPSVSFVEGHVVEDVAIQARARNLVVGGRVTTNKLVRGVKKGSLGTLMVLSKEPLVKWDEGSLVDVPRSTVARNVTLASLQGVVATPPVKSAVRTAPEPEVVLPLGVPWTMHTGMMGSAGLRHTTLAALYQVYFHRSAGPSLVMIDQDAPGLVRCLTNIKPRGLIVLPYVQDLDIVDVSSKSKTLVGVTAGELVFKCNIEPKCLEGDEEGSKSPERSGDEEGEIEHPPSWFNLFWKIYLNETGETSSVGLDLCQMEVTVPLGFAKIEDVTLRGAVKAKGQVSLMVPFLTNGSELQRGDVLHYCK